MRKASLGYLPHLREVAKGVKQIQERGVGGAKLADERIGRSFEQFGDALGVLMKPWSRNNESDVVASAASGAPGHLLQL